MSIQWVVFCLSCFACAISWSVNLEKIIKKLQKITLSERERKLQRELKCQQATEELFTLVRQEYWSWQSTEQEGRIEKFKKLLAQGARVNAYDEYYCTPLYWAVLHNYNDIVELLLKHGADVHMGNAHQTTPLHLAIVQSNQRIVNSLIEYGANIYAKDKWGDRPIDIAPQASNTGRYLRKLNIFKAREPILRLLRYYLPDYLAQHIVAYYIYPDG